MTTRDELMEIISNAYVESDDYDYSDFLAKTADDILAAGYRKPRTITTIEELDALPAGAVVLDAFKCARTKRWADTHMPGGWTSGGRMPISSKELADGSPMNVLFDPKEQQ